MRDFGELNDIFSGHFFFKHFFRTFFFFFFQDIFFFFFNNIYHNSQRISDSFYHISSIYLRTLGQLFYAIFTSFFLKLKIWTTFQRHLKQHRYIIQLLHHMIYSTNSYKSFQLNSSSICSIKATNYLS